MDELDRLFRKIYEDNVNGKLNDERFCKLSDGYEAEQEQLKQEIESLTAEVSEADMETTNVSKLIAVTKKYVVLSIMRKERNSISIPPLMSTPAGGMWKLLKNTAPIHPHSSSSI